MNSEILSNLCCPQCPDAELILENPQYEKDRVASGALKCKGCKKIYPVRQFIPRFTDTDSTEQTTEAQIAQNFGDAWTIYADQRAVNPYTLEQFLDWIEPLTPDDFTGKMVLEAGSGLGGFTAYAASDAFGAKQVIGLDISHSVDAAIPLLLEHPNLSFVQGDILNPPLKPASIDLTYSIGVLHHLSHPQIGFNRLAPLVKPLGQFFIWVYGAENNGFVVWVVDPLRKLMSKLPVNIVRTWVATPLATILFGLLHTAYHPGLPGIFKMLTMRLPYYDYFQWLRKTDYAYVVGMVTDQLIPPQTHYLKKQTLIRWVKEAGLDLSAITQRNRMSWRVLSAKKTEAPDEAVHASAQ
ncbi:MAG: methyltransferase domain-containing protein [Vampirovibrio sp.]|nr:methyltransferase domain-containing protein [Vampirovibrio sp.]